MTNAAAITGCPIADGKRPKPKPRASRRPSARRGQNCGFARRDLAMSVSDRIFRALLRLLPAEFRGDYERELQATFRAERQSARGFGLVSLWLATMVDVVRTAPGEHLDILRRDVHYAGRM